METVYRRSSRFRPMNGAMSFEFFRVWLVVKLCCHNGRNGHAVGSYPSDIREGAERYVPTISMIHLGHFAQAGDIRRVANS